MSERTPHERETAIFSNAEQAHAFSERVAERFERERVQNPDRKKEIVAEEVAREFEHEGEGVDADRFPWEHTPEEHRETQELVNVAFEHSLRSAIRKAQEGQHYPRNIDLMHDVITTEMYELITQTEMNKQDTIPWLLGILGMMLVALLIIVLLFIL